MAVKMQREYGDKLNTIFVESQGSTKDKIQKLALKKKWLGSSAIWTSERPVQGGGGLPNYVLLSPEGKVVMKGHPMRDHKKIEDYLASLKRVKVKAPKDLPKLLHGAYKNMAKGKLGKALKDAESIAARKTDDQDLTAAAAEMVANIKGQIEAKFARVDRAIEAGSYAFAAGQLKTLTKLVKGTSLENEADEREATLKSEELAAAIKAEKSLVKITGKLYEKGATPATKKQLLSLAKKHEGTKAAERAAELAGYLE